MELSSKPIKYQGHEYSIEVEDNIYSAWLCIDGKPVACINALTIAQEKKLIRSDEGQ